VVLRGRIATLWLSPVSVPFTTGGMPHWVLALNLLSELDRPAIARRATILRPDASGSEAPPTGCHFSGRSRQERGPLSPEVARKSVRLGRASRAVICFTEQRDDGISSGSRLAPPNGPSVQWVEQANPILAVAPLTQLNRPQVCGAMRAC
jgi:hypothetical protein